MIRKLNVNNFVMENLVLELGIIWSLYKIQKVLFPLLLPPPVSQCYFIFV